MILFMNLLKKLVSDENKTNNKKKIENLVFLIIILVATLIIINIIWNGKDIKQNENTKNNITEKVLAGNEDNTNIKEELEKRLEDILGTIKGVGKVNVFINYSESSSIVPIYDETTTTSTTEEGDSTGGTRNVTQTELKKDVVFSESSGKKDPVTQKTLMPIIQGAIVTAEGAENIAVKTNIINAVGAVTGLSIDKVQVFQMK